jgi:hypothetical protein
LTSGLPDVRMLFAPSVCAQVRDTLDHL